MFSKIMAPVDLGHVEALSKALGVAAGLAKHYGAAVCYVGVTSQTPSAEAHTPAEFEQKLQAFAAEQAAAHGIAAEAKSYATHDPAIDLDATLAGAVGEVGADLVVMASHVPGLGDRFWPSHGGSLASHAAASVFLVR